MELAPDLVSCPHPAQAGLTRGNFSVPRTRILLCAAGVALDHRSPFALRWRRPEALSQSGFRTYDSPVARRQNATHDAHQSRLPFRRQYKKGVRDKLHRNGSDTRRFSCQRESSMLTKRGR